jgi:uncharacterized protein
LQHFFAVEKLSTYNIAFKGLAEGTHVFDYKIGNTFFDLFENSLVEQADVNVKIMLEKRNTFISLNISLTGTVRLICDRCLDWYDQPVKNMADLFIKFGDIQFNDGDDVIWLHPDDYQFNVAQIIYEYISLSVPLKHIHPSPKEGKTGCNPEMLKKLEEFSHPSEKKSDERWKQLKNLLNNN